jgi:hypothetical protein
MITFLFLAQYALGVEKIRVMDMEAAIDMAALVDQGLSDRNLSNWAKNTMLTSLRSVDVAME